jgi:hypothetical protein
MGYLPRFPGARGASVSFGGSAPSRGRLSTLWRGLCAVAETIADYHAASAMYEDLARLSDAELHRRGLSRASLARDVVAAYGRVQSWRRIGRA